MEISYSDKRMAQLTRHDKDLERSDKGGAEERARNIRDRGISGGTGLNRDMSSAPKAPQPFLREPQISHSLSMKTSVKTCTNVTHTLHRLSTLMYAHAFIGSSSFSAVSTGIATKLVIVTARLSEHPTAKKGRLPKAHISHQDKPHLVVTSYLLLAMFCPCFDKRSFFLDS